MFGSHAIAENSIATDGIVLFGSQTLDANFTQSTDLSAILSGSMDVNAFFSKLVAASGILVAEIDISSTKLTQIETELKTLNLLTSSKGLSDDSIVNLLKIKKGYEDAVYAALTNELDATLKKSKKRWIKTSLKNVDPIENNLSNFVESPKELNLILSQISLVEDSKEAYEKQKNLKVGQSIVDKKGSMWRWDGFISEENQQNKNLIEAQLKIKELVNQQNKFRISLNALRLKKESQLKVQSELNETLKKENIDLEKNYREYDATQSEFSTLIQKKSLLEFNIKDIKEKIDLHIKEERLSSKELEKIKSMEVSSPKLDNNKNEKEEVQKTIQDLDQQLDKKREEINLIKESIMKEELNESFHKNDLQKTEVRITECLRQIEMLEKREIDYIRENKKLENLPSDLREKINHYQGQFNEVQKEITQTVSGGTAKGRVVSWDSTNGILKYFQSPDLHTHNGKVLAFDDATNNVTGVTSGTAKDTLTAPYNNIEAVKQLFTENKDDIAAVIIEPVAGNMGCVLPNDGFLQKLKQLCVTNKSLLVFDEVMTGFRLALGGAQEVLNVDADIMTFGKVIGGGLPVGAFAARKEITGQEYISGSMVENDTPLEANKPVTVTESWLNVDRDGDGIAELKHIITVGDYIMYEEDIDSIPLACLTPIDIPFEFYGLSMADFTRSSTLASTAILRGFVENTYLTNYSPKLADPNVVDFSALQNMKPKQIIPTNGSPVNAVQQMQPETISPGTVPVLEYLQLIKEQATGMSKAAQGLNDTLYISGNSEQKLAAVQSAAQTVQASTP